MSAAEAILAAAALCPCGSSSHERVDECLVCSECGRVLEEDCLVNYGQVPSSSIAATDNIVPEGCTGAHLSAAKSSVDNRRRAKVRRLQAQASNHGRDLDLSDAAISRALGLIKDHTRGNAPSETSAVAAALVLGARIERYPVAMKNVCLILEIPFSDLKRSLASLQRQMDGPVPAIQVCTTSALISLPQRKRYLKHVFFHDGAACDRSGRIV